MPPKDPPLDEIQWRSPQIVAEMGGVHSNTVLHYFARSPFFEETSNNAVLTNQAFHNAGMYHLIQTREAFEGRLRTMAGLEYMVAQEPAEMGPGVGTGVWVVRKQTRRKRGQGLEDEIVVHATYFVVGDNIYQSPSLADILTSRINTVTEALSKVIPAAESTRTWTPALGNVYQQPKTDEGPVAKAGLATSTTSTTTSAGGRAGSSKPKAKMSALDSELQRLAEDSFFRHLRYGGDYLDEKPITGQPGNFHIASSATATNTGRKEKPVVPLPPVKTTGIGALGAETIKEEKKGGKADKSPKTPSMPKPKRRKSKAGPASAS